MNNDDERWYAMGVSARKAAKRGGCLGKLILLGIIIVILLALFDAFVGNGEILRGIFRR